MKLLLPKALREKIVAEARAMFPRECCGLLEGAVKGDFVQIVTAYAAHNLSKDDDRFEIDPSDHFRALRTARASGNAIVGCYHSHPNGHAEPSVRDGEGEEGFIWLIAAVKARDVSLSAFRRAGNGWQRLRITEAGRKAA